MPKTPHPARARIILALKMALAFGLLTAVIVLNRQQIGDVLKRRPDVRFFALGFVFYLAGLMLAFVRWSFYVRAQGLHFRVRDGLRLGFIANLFNFVVPGGPVGGDVVRAAFLCREQARKAQAIASVVLDRFIGILALFLLACAGGTLAWQSLDNRTRRLVVVAWSVSGVVVLILLTMFSPALYRPLARRFAHRPRLAKRLHELVATGEAYRTHIGVVIAGLGMALVTHALIIMSFYFASLALFPKVPSLASHFLIVPLVLVTTAIPLPFGALGLSEGISAHLFGLAAHPGGAVAMMGFRVVQYGTAVISAIVYAANIRQVRELAVVAEQLKGEPEGEVPILPEASASEVA
ncbi:MAG TPA: lysylphosphatidylglycerol synthase transmembrane domain-containing protein [Isosphaeraceae bacterium]|jgi:hypothetical protein|nr:lysylphosphatidylglycerol synthase transmembrane domain-containing protein [Isosphaeraceae bacterium]